VTTDGDSDRPLLMGVKAGELRVFPGDLLGATVAEFLKADAAAVPISANPTLEDWLAARGISLRRTRIGSPYVIEAMASLKASGKRVVAWEANGGFLLGSSLALGEKVLKALPTRDAVLPILGALSFAKQRQRDLASLMERFPKSFGWSDLIEDFPREDGQRLVAYFAPQDLSVEEVSFARGEIVLLGEGGRELFRLPEADPQAELWLERKKRLEEVFSARLGFSPLVGINVLDGVRCRFADGEVAHFRPSGNAPQLRIYAYAATLARAREIAKLAVAKGGLLELLAHKL